VPDRCRRAGHAKLNAGPPDRDEGPNAWLVRHGETEWARLGRHTGRTDIPLTDVGRQQALAVRSKLEGHRFALVLSSPLSRALDTARLAGFGDAVEIDPDLAEWDYGAWEGLTTPEIREQIPDWTLWTNGTRGGETPEQVAARCDRVIARVRAGDGDALLFGHGHLLRVLTARWLDLPPSDGRHFALATATVSVLGWERETPVVERWNESCS
jgi:broad specificity phosphatase PhoE